MQILLQSLYKQHFWSGEQSVSEVQISCMDSRSQAGVGLKLGHSLTLISGNKTQGEQVNNYDTTCFCSLEHLELTLHMKQNVLQGSLLQATNREIPFLSLRSAMGYFLSPVLDQNLYVASQG